MYILWGIVVKLITGVDDIVAQIPIIARTAKTNKAKIAFGLGMITTILMAILFSFFFAQIVQEIPYSNYVSGGLIILLAIGIQLEIFKRKAKGKGNAHVLKIFLLGLIASTATIIDDVIAYIPLFMHGIQDSIYASAGIMIAALIEILAIMTFSKQLQKIPHKKEITSIGLIVLGVLVIIGLV